MTGDSDTWMNTFNSAPIGPATTLARNFSIAVTAFVGLVCLVVPTLMDVPWPNRVVVAVIGSISLATSLAGALRWKPLLRKMRNDAARTSARAVFAFMRATSSGGESGDIKFIGKGWVLIRQNQLLITPHTGVLPTNSSPRAVDVSEIQEIAFVPGDSTVFNRVEIKLRDREIATFVVAPANGSGLRGATEHEVQESVNLLRSAIE